MHIIDINKYPECPELSVGDEVEFEMSYAFSDFARWECAGLLDDFGSSGVFTSGVIESANEYLFSVRSKFGVHAFMTPNHPSYISSVWGLSGYPRKVSEKHKDNDVGELKCTCKQLLVGIDADCAYHQESIRK